MSDGIVYDGPLTVADLEAAIEDGLDALAGLVGTDQEGVATALRLYRSGLCGALETADAIAAERDALRDEVKTWRSRTDYVLRLWADHEPAAAAKAAKDWDL